MFNLLFSDSDYSDEDQFTCESEQLNPGENWEKPERATVILTFASIIINPENSMNQKAVLGATMNGRESVMCVLLPSKPTQKMKIILSPEISATLANSGSCPLSFSFLLKEF